MKEPDSQLDGSKFTIVRRAAGTRKARLVVMLAPILSQQRWSGRMRPENETRRYVKLNRDGLLNILIVEPPGEGVHPNRCLSLTDDDS